MHSAVTMCQCLHEYRSVVEQGASSSSSLCVSWPLGGGRVEIECQRSRSIGRVWIAGLRLLVSRLGRMSLTPPTSNAWCPCPRLGAMETRVCSGRRNMRRITAESATSACVKYVAQTPESTRENARGMSSTTRQNKARPNTTLLAPGKHRRHRTLRILYQQAIR